MKVHGFARVVQGQIEALSAAPSNTLLPVNDYQDSYDRRGRTRVVPGVVVILTRATVVPVLWTTFALLVDVFDSVAPQPAKRATIRMRTSKARVTE